MIPLSVAPMMDRTDRHFRYFMRRITRRSLLYTEMLHTSAVLHGERERLLGFHDDEHPIAIQLGGDVPADLAEAARVAADWGYDEINLNVGCPSARVQHRRFGACLMAHPDVVARCVEAMRDAVDIEVTVKHRIGIDDIDRYEDMARFVRTVADAGCRRFTVHARKAWLQGLSPHQNRTIPPLRHDEVYRLKDELPHLDIEINGGVRTVEDTLTHLSRCDGVMIGRAAAQDPWLFAGLERAVFGEEPVSPSRFAAIEAVFPYLDELATQDEPAHRLTRHLTDLFAGQPGAGVWRRHLSEAVHVRGSAPLATALAAVRSVQRAAEAA